jgi:hypothetical protein
MSESVTEEALSRLPRWVRVAFAAKCGRRVQPLLRRFWPAAPSDLIAAFDRAVDLAEQSAAQARACDGLQDAATAAEAHLGAAAGAEVAAYAVARTAVAAARAALAAEAGDGAVCSRAAHEAFGWADHVARAVRVSGMDVVLGHDLRTLRQAVERGELADGTPVTPDAFALERELKTYCRELPRLLREEGKYVVIRDQEVAGTWATYEDALQAGYERFGLVPFLVKKIQANGDPLLTATTPGAPCPT